jgi:hypothetical protein
MDNQVVEERSLQEWVTPTFERVPLNEALLQPGTVEDADGFQAS